MPFKSLIASLSSSKLMSIPSQVTFCGSPDSTPNLKNIDMALVREHYAPDKSESISIFIHDFYDRYYNLQIYCTESAAIADDE